MSSLSSKKVFLEHQKRDLPCCHPSERDGRILEIEQLEKEIKELEGNTNSKYYLVYDFSCLRLEFWEVPEGQHIDDIAGKYFSMDNQDDNKMTYHSSLEEAKAKAKELLEADLEKAQEKLANLATQTVEKVRGRYPKEDYED